MYVVKKCVPCITIHTMIKLSEYIDGYFDDYEYTNKPKYFVKIIQV